MNDIDRHIVHMDLDAFFVSVEELVDPSLKGKPVIIGGNSRERGVVTSCSYEARAFGVHAAMPMKLATRLCPHAILRKGDHESYSKKSKEVTQIINDAAPLYEKTSIDEFFIDISGMDRFFGCYKWTSELRTKIIREAGLPISFGLAHNKTISKMATNEAKPSGQLNIPFMGTQNFLNPLSIQKIPMVGDQTAKKLRYMGLHKIAQLIEIPAEMIVHVLGKNGLSIWKKAHGIDHTPVIPFHERKSISTESTFNSDTINVDYLKNMITSMIENVNFDLRKEQKLCACLTVKLRYTNFDTYTTQIKFPHTSSDRLLVKHAHALFEKLYNKRMRVRLIGVRLSDLADGAYQIDLFNDDEKLIHLTQALDQIKKRFGKNAIGSAAALGHTIKQFHNPFKG